MALTTDVNGASYVNSRFEKFLKVLHGGDEQASEATLAELHRSFTSLVMTQPFLLRSGC